MNKKLLTILLLFCAAAAHAADDAYTYRAKHFELEFGAHYTYIRDDKSERENYIIPLLPTVIYGADERVEVGFAPSYLYSHQRRPHDSVHRSTDAALNAKWRFFDNGAGLAAAIKPSIAAPVTGGDYRGSLVQNITYRADLILTWAPPKWEFNFNTGVFSAGDGGKYTSAWHNAFEARYRMLPPLDLVAEAGFDLEDGANSTPYNTRAGLRYYASNMYEFDFGYERLFNARAMEYAIDFKMKIKL